MVRQRNPLVEFKPGMYGLKLDVLELFRRMFGARSLDPTEAVAQRFVQVFNDHGIATTQIPRLVPKVTLERLQCHSSLIAAISNEVLDETARLFGVRRSWLEGDDDRIYDCYHCYKDPLRFFEDLKTLKREPHVWPLEIFCSVPSLDYKRDSVQIVVPILKEKCAEIDGEAIYRYRVYGDCWDWNYWKCRIQLKAMVRIWDATVSAPIHIFRISPKYLELLQKGARVPQKCYRTSVRLQTANLEDFALCRNETAEAKEEEELSDVLEYMKLHKLHLLAD